MATTAKSIITERATSIGGIKIDHMHLGNIILQTQGTKGGWRKFSECFRHIIEFHHSDRPDLYELDGNKIRLTDKSYYNFGMVRHDLDNYYEIPPNTLYTNLIDDGIGIFHIGRKILIKIEPRRLVWFILKYGEVTPVYYVESIEGNEISLIAMDDYHWWL